MTWPVTDAGTTNLDAGADNPSLARADLLQAVQNCNSIKNHVTAAAQTVLDDTTVAAMLATLGGAPSASPTFTGDVKVDKTITGGGTTGAQTINKTAGSVNFAAAATSLVVTNSLASANSIILVTIAANDATFTSAQVVAAAGSFTIYANAAATAETRVNFLVLN